MPQRFFLERDLREYGLTVGDLRFGKRNPLDVWRLPETAEKLLCPLLTRTGFDLDQPIHVHESNDPAGFVFAQQGVPGSSGRLPLSAFGKTSFPVVWVEMRG